jgi:hypothetical protein
MQLLHSRYPPAAYSAAPQSDGRHGEPMGLLLTQATAEVYLCTRCALPASTDKKIRQNRLIGGNLPRITSPDRCSAEAARECSVSMQLLVSCPVEYCYGSKADRSACRQGELEPSLAIR